MRKTFLVFSVLGAFTALLVPLSGCDGSSSGTAGTAGAAGTGSGVDAESACKDFVAAICGQLNKCSPFAIQITYGDQATCEERAMPDCLALPDLSGSNTDAAAIETCADAYKAASCDEFFVGAPKTCRIAGEKADGAVCATSVECEGLICDTDKEGACGACATILDAGAACDPMKSYCDTGLFCDDTAKKCTSRAKKGESCSGTVPCADTLACNGGTCGAPLAEGAGCAMGSCDTIAGLFCSPKSMKCEKIGIAKLGAACGYDMASGTISLCEAGAKCDTPAMATMGTCNAQPKEGDSCVVDAQSGDGNCVAGLQCVSGKCSADYPTCK